MYHAPVAANGPPPICFNCSKEGHFVVDCPESKRTSFGGPPPAPGPNPSHGNYPGNQPPQWGNGQNMATPGTAMTQFPKPPPVVTRYAVPGQPPQYGNSPAPYGPSPTAPPYQHPGSAPPGQSYPPPSQNSYSPQQYGASAPPYSNSVPSQSYIAPPPNSQYGQGYQPPPHNQYPPFNGPPQYNGPPAQQYGSPAASQYQSPVNQYQSRNGSYSGPSQHQWSNTPPASVISPSFSNALPQQQPNPRRSSSIQREYSGTPSQQPQPQSQPQQTPRNEYGQVSDGHQQTPQTPASGFNLNGLTNNSQTSPIDGSYFPKSASMSVVSSRASTPYGRYGSVSSSSGKQKAPSVSAKSSPATPNVKVMEPISLAEEAALKEAAKESSKKDADEDEEGEYTEEDLLQEQFNWDYKKIFKEPEPTEHVALSQPLSYTYNVTPVPLMDVRWGQSVSRYARKDNLKEYVRPIRSQPQWDYLKEDPAFSDIQLEGPLIPLREVREWMAKRHGVDEVTPPTEEVPEVPEDPSATSLKRAWLDEQEDVDNQIQLEVSIEPNEQNPNKRQKVEGIEEDSCIVVDTSGTPTQGTPIIGRAGTPTFGIADDVWAPEPGEAASAPMDPTEALLASLGVSGAPKPPREQSNPPTLVAAEDHYATPPFGNMPHSMSPQAHPSRNDTPQNNSIPNMPPQGSQGSPQAPPQNNLPYGNPQYNTPQQGSPSNSNPYGGPPESNVPYSNHGLPVYNNNMPPQPNPGYGPPQQYGTPYSNPPPPQHHPYNNNQYGPPQGQYHPPGQYGPPQNQYPPQGQYGPPQSQYNGPPHNQYGPPHGQYGPPQDQYGPPQAQYNGPPQYGPLQGQYGPPQPQYNGPSQSQYGPSQGQYGPPQGQYNGPPQNQYGPPQYGNPPYGQPPQDQPPYANGPQQGNPPYQPFNNQGQGNQSLRQDSGYASVGGSYSNISGANGAPSGGPPQQGQQQVNGNNSTLIPRVDGGDDTPSPNDSMEKKKDEKKDAEVNLESEDPKTSEPVESPLSPTSAEILGKLTQPSKPRKIIRVISGKNKEKRPAPVVAEAYSRRW